MTEKDFISIVSPYTMTSVNCISHLYNTLENIRLNEIDGDFVECGVWKGGNILGIIKYLQHHNMTDRNVWLYDTFCGMTKPSTVDFKNDGTYTSDETLNYWNNNKWCYCSLEDVKKTLSRINFPEKNINYIVGDVCVTLLKNENLPNKISLLRLDTDWYDSTKIELEILYPRLVLKGTLIVDDFNYWHGSKKAVVEYFNDVSDFKTLDNRSAVYKIKI